MEAEIFRVAAVLDFFDEGVEIIVGAAMSGEDFERTAPGDAGIGDGVEFMGIGMEGEFVEDAIAAFAGLGVGIGGKGMDAATSDELKSVDGVTAVFGLAAFDGLGDDLEVFEEMFAIFEEELGLDLVAAGDPGVLTGGFLAFAADE